MLASTSDRSRYWGKRCGKVPESGAGPRKITNHAQGVPKNRRAKIEGNRWGCNPFRLDYRRFGRLVLNEPALGQCENAISHHARAAEKQNHSRNQQDGEGDDQWSGEVGSTQARQPKPAGRDQGRKSAARVAVKEDGRRRTRKFQRRPGEREAIGDAGVRRKKVRPPRVLPWP